MAQDQSKGKISVKKNSVAEMRMTKSVSKEKEVLN